jgi:hypothetical protein
LIKTELQIRWPSLPHTSLTLEVRTPDILAAILFEHMCFSRRRAVAEAEMFWEELQERFRKAT